MLFLYVLLLIHRYILGKKNPRRKLIGTRPKNKKATIHPPSPLCLLICIYIDILSLSLFFLKLRRERKNRVLEGHEENSKLIIV